MTAAGGIVGTHAVGTHGVGTNRVGKALLAAVLVVAASIMAAPAMATVPVAPVRLAGAEAATTVEPPHSEIAAETSFVPPTTRLAAPPSSLADGIRALAQPVASEGWNEAWVRRGLSLREIVRAAAAEPWLLPMTIAGIGLIVIASYARRRQRRRVGWGVLPERNVRRERSGAAD